MRPSRRLLVVGAILLGVSALIIAMARIPIEAAIALWAIFVLVALLDYFVSQSGGAVSASIDAPQEAYTGENAILTVRLRCRTGDLPTRIQAKLETDPDVAMSPVFRIAGGQPTADGEVEIPAKRRGTIPIYAVWLQWPSRFGLWDFIPRKPLDAMLKVVPNIRPVSTGQIDIAVRSELYGVKDNPFTGEGSEFHQLREFTSGMDVRAIDWKRSARRRDLVAKEMRAERNHQIILALDNGFLMREEIENLPKIDHAVNAALATAWAAGLGGDLVGLYSFDAKPRVFLPPQPGRAAFAQLRSQTAEMEYRSVETNHTLAMANLNSILKRRSLIVVFSDFVDKITAELLVENLHVLNRTHVLVFVTISDPALDPARDSGPATMQAMAESVSAAQMRRERTQVLDSLRHIGVICIETPPNRLTAALVSTYLMVKSQELI